VDAGESRVFRLQERLRARRERLERRRDERRQEARDARPLDRRHRALDVVCGGGRIAEVDAGEAVHLQVDEPGQLEPAGAGRFGRAALAGRSALMRRSGSRPGGKGSGGNGQELPPGRLGLGRHFFASRLASATAFAALTRPKPKRSLKPFAS
jgi:hypothetical protein